MRLVFAGGRDAAAAEVVTTHFESFLSRFPVAISADINSLQSLR
jgi:hypothetical protein